LSIQYGNCSETSIRGTTTPILDADEKNKNPANVDPKYEIQISRDIARDENIAAVIM
jgi:hypothetical protein